MRDDNKTRPSYIVNIHTHTHTRIYTEYLCSGIIIIISITLLYATVR